MEIEFLFIFIYIFLAGRQSIPPINEECRLRCVENVAQTINSNEITELGYDLASFIGGVCTSYCYGERLSYPPLYEKAKRRSKFLVSSK